MGTPGVTSGTPRVTSGTPGKSRFVKPGAREPAVTDTRFRVLKFEDFWFLGFRV